MGCATSKRVAPDATVPVSELDVSPGDRLSAVRHPAVGTKHPHGGGGDETGDQLMILLGGKTLDSANTSHITACAPQPVASNSPAKATHRGRTTSQDPAVHTHLVISPAAVHPPHAHEGAALPNHICNDSPAVTHPSHTSDTPSAGSPASQHSTLSSAPADTSMAARASTSNTGDHRAGVPVSTASMVGAAAERRFSTEYTMCDLLGTGGFGEVRLAIRKEDGRRVAVKIISKLKFGSDEDHANMVTEVDLMRRVRGNKNVVEFYECFEDRSGELMDRIVKSTSFSERDASRYFQQMLLAVKHCHENLVVHRDLKPENFLLESPAHDAELKLTDFGLSTAITSQTEVLTEGLGSAYYIAPEIFKRRYTKSVDVWALGIILYLLLCGEVPFGHTAETESEVYKAIQEQSLHFGSFWNSITSAARELVSGLLQKDSSKRYTIEEALAHPWVAGVAAVDTPMDRALIQGLMSFNNKNKFKKQALKAVASKLSANDVRTLRDAFHKLDTDNTGFITYSELKVALATAGMGGDDEQIDKMMKSVDSDGDNRISWEEFLEATMERQMLSYQNRLWEVFCQYDVDSSGTITVDELRIILKDETPEKIEKYIAEYDTDKDGTINYEEFLRMFLPKTLKFRVTKSRA